MLPQQNNRAPTRTSFILLQSVAALLDALHPTHCTFKDTKPGFFTRNEGQLCFLSYFEPHTKMYCDQKWNVKKGSLETLYSEAQRNVWMLLVWTWNDSKAFDLTVLPRVSGHFHRFFTELLFNFPTKTFLS